MSRRLKLLILMVVLILVSLFVFLEKDVAYEANMDPDYMLEKDSEDKLGLEDESAPDFTLENLGSRKISLSDYRGKIVFINFWVSWQGSSESELLELEKLSKENDDLVVLAINVREDRDLVEKYIERLGINLNELTVLLDDSGEIGIDYLVGEMPITYFIDSKGCLIDYADGALTYEDMNLILNSIREKDN